MAESADDLQTLVDRTSMESKRFGMTISRAKTEVQIIKPGERTAMIDLGGAHLKQVKGFVNLGGMITDTVDSGADISRRVGLATSVARRLDMVRRINNISARTKVRLYKALVLSMLLYNSET